MSLIKDTVGATTEYQKFAQIEPMAQFLNETRHLWLYS